MDMSLILDTLLTSLNEPPLPGRKQFDVTPCGMLCQHPACWAAIRSQQKGIARTVSPLESSSDDSDSELDLPKQSICNLLEDYGETQSDRYPLSTGGRPSHQWESNSRTVTRSSHSLGSISHKLKAPHNTKGSLFSKGTAASHTRRTRAPLVEVQEVFDKTDLNSQWDETFVTKQYYMWVPNPRKSSQKTQNMAVSRETYQSMPLLMKDLTECMVPPEIEHKREETIMKRQQRTRSPPRSIQFKNAATTPAVPSVTDLDMEGINELLSLPKDALIRVLEHTKKSDFTSKGKLRTILQEYVRYDERARMALDTHELFQPRKMQILKQQTASSRFEQNKPPIFHMDDEMVLDRMSSVNTPVKEKDSARDDQSVESFPRYKKPLPMITGPAALNKQEVPIADSYSSLMHFSGKKSRIPAISLGLPELPSGVKTTRAFSYNRKSIVDFSLGPIISPPSTVRSSSSGDYSEHGTTIKVHAPLSGIGFLGDERRDDQAIHSVSPAMSTHVPYPPAVTPATFMSPTKSAPTFKDYKDLSREPTHISISVSQIALPPSRDVRDTTLLSSMPSNISQRQTLSPMDTKVTATPDELALDTINETAREAMDESVNSSHRTVTIANEPFSPRKEEMVALTLEPSALASIHTGVSPVMKSARSVESCPSPEQWPLISELSFENMMPRPSVSEPALSARNRHLTSRSLDDDKQGSVSERDYARKVLDEKMTAESPAPPPPSPEPKDSEHRSRKDIKSRDSLSMAPLFEVSEIEEGLPAKEAREETEGHGKDGEKRLKQMRQIHAVIPQVKPEQDKKEESDENDDVMVSQITVTHVAPKEPDPKREKGEKVQETFLNVDIPAEETSSVKAEHGSSHQEDISSNNTIVQSNATATESEVSGTTAAPQSEPKNENEIERERQATDGQASDGGGTTYRNNALTLDDELPQRENSIKGQSDDSAMSPELMCDSARFLNHELVSPVDGELLEDDGGSRMLPLLTGISGQNTERSAADEEEQRWKNAEDGTMPEEGTEEVGDDLFERKKDEIEREPSSPLLVNGTDGKAENEETAGPPGSFFFHSSSSNTTPRENGGDVAAEDSQKAVDADTIHDKLSTNATPVQETVTENSPPVQETDTKTEDVDKDEEKDNENEQEVKKEEISSVPQEEKEKDEEDKEEQSMSERIADKQEEEVKDRKEEKQEEDNAETNEGVDDKDNDDVREDCDNDGGKKNLSAKDDDNDQVEVNNDEEKNSATGGTHATDDDTNIEKESKIVANANKENETTPTTTATTTTGDEMVVKENDFFEAPRTYSNAEGTVEMDAAETERDATLISAGTSELLQDTVEVNVENSDIPAEEENDVVDNLQPRLEPEGV